MIIKKHFICTFFLTVFMSLITFCQNKAGFEKLPIPTQNNFKQVASTFHTGTVDYFSVEKKLKGSGIDLSNIPIEDAMMYMFMLISEDARKDMRSMLEEMEATRKKRSALREAETLMKKELDSLRARNSYRYPSDSIATATKIQEKQIKFKQNSNLVKENLQEENTITKKINAAELHLQAVENAIKELKQRQAQRKQQ